MNFGAKYQIRRFGRFLQNSIFDQKYDFWHSVDQERNVCCIHQKCKCCLCFFGSARDEAPPLLISWQFERAEQKKKWHTIANYKGSVSARIFIFWGLNIHYPSSAASVGARIDHLRLEKNQLPTRLKVSNQIYFWSYQVTIQIVYCLGVQS